MTVTPGSKQVYTMIAENGALADLIAAGVRVLESACGPCLGIGQAPASGIATVRAFNRNFKGRSGTADDSLLPGQPGDVCGNRTDGVITDPRTLGRAFTFAPPSTYLTNDNMIIPPLPPAEAAKVEIMRGPNIKPACRSANPWPTASRDVY